MVARCLNIVVLVSLFSCGTKEQKEHHGPCEIEFRYSQTNPNNERDLVRYDSYKISDSCESFRGENVRTLEYRLKTKARPSIGTLGLCSLAGRSVNLERFSLADGNVEVVNLAQEDWDGPLDNFDKFFMLYVFPKNTGTNLYPTDVKLVISR